MIDTSARLCDRSFTWQSELEAAGWTEVDRLLIMASAVPRSGAVPSYEAPGYRVIPLPDRQLERHLRLHHDGFGQSQQETTRADRRLMGANHAAGAEFLWIVEEATREPVGTAALLPAGSTAELFALSVLPDHRRRGLGTRLVLEACARMEARSAGLVYLEAEIGSPAIYLYRALGFDPVWHQVSYRYV